jgi:hypothetical protein
VRKIDMIHIVNDECSRRTRLMKRYGQKDRR